MHFIKQMIRSAPRFLAAFAVFVALTNSLAMSTFAQGAQASAKVDQKIFQALFDEKLLPEKVRATLQRIRAAARSGDIDELRAALEWNELPPDIGLDKKTDPIEHWKSISSDQTARDIMANMLNILDRGYSVANKGSSTEIYIWPYLAEMPLKNLPPSAEVDLFRLTDPESAKKMKAAGAYQGYHLVIGKDGTWHAFFKK